MPKSYNNDFGRPKGRPGPIVNVFRSEKDGKRVLRNRCKKNEAKFGGVQIPGLIDSIDRGSPKG